MEPGWGLEDHTDLRKEYPLSLGNGEGFIEVASELGIEDKRGQHPAG